MSDVARFWTKVNRSSGRCWEWSEGRVGGYGRFYTGGRGHYAHRWIWEYVHGSVGDRRVLHRCDNPACVRLDHLFVGTQADNVADMYAKSRNYGVIRAEQADEIRQRYSAGGVLQRDLAAEYGCTQSNISVIVNGRSHVRSA